MAAEARREKAWRAVVGAAVGDASAARCHWQYDPKKLAEIVGDRELAFYDGEQLCNPFYTVKPGASTCYGDQLVCVAASLAQTAPTVDVDDIARRFRERFHDAEDYKEAAPRKQKYAYGGDQQARSPPIAGPWIHGTIEKFLSGEVDDKDTSADALMRSIPVAAVAAVADFTEDQLRDAVDAVVCVTQRSNVAREHALLVARALVAVIRGVGDYDPRHGIEAVVATAPGDDDNSSAKTVATALTAAAAHENYAASIEVLRSGLGLAESAPAKLIN
mmetsp:Transcript_27247/g.83652  ORF Transcript_27247/g.83652 Transcript_27247/m.83652 type:complete len:275 (-) Transcript_27247:477-1301(-)